MQIVWMNARRDRLSVLQRSSRLSVYRDPSSISRTFKFKLGPSRCLPPLWLSRLSQSFATFCIFPNLSHQQSKPHSCCDPDCPRLRRMNVHSVYTSKRFASDSRGVVITDVVVLAIGEVQDIQRDIQILGDFPVHPEVGGHASDGAHRVVFDQRCCTDVSHTQ